MHAFFNMGGQDLYAHLLLEIDKESTIQSPYQNFDWIRRVGLCGYHGDLLCCLLPALLTVLGNASPEHAVRDIPALFHYPGGLQHFF